MSKTEIDPNKVAAISHPLLISDSLELIEVFTHLNPGQRRELIELARKMGEK